MEFGPRALGCRSILGDARSPEMQKVMNLKIKFRESFRPFAPSVLQEQAASYFDLAPATESPYMLLVAQVAAEQCLDADAELARNRGLDKLGVLRSTVPAITHVDYSARLQTVDAERHGRYHRLLRRFFELTGCPVVINTSFNVRGEPIVCTPADAYNCFMATKMDVLVLERCLVLKEAQPESSAVSTEAHLSRFELD
jgi:carbamoyltransferase